MTTQKFYVYFLAGLILFIAACQPAVLAQRMPQPSGVKFNSFTATYYLSRDSENQSLLSTEEVILADFFSNARLTGIIRTIPQKYQGRSVEVNVQNVTDASGNNIPYKIDTKDDNLVINIGNPSIYLFGSQTFRIKYQTSNVVNLSDLKNEFLLNVNGRGWDQGFERIGAFLHIPKSFSSNLISKPTCYIGHPKSTSYDCTVNQQDLPEETLISVKSSNPVGANSALVLKTAFQTATFSNEKRSLTPLLLVLPLLIGLLVLALWFKKTRRS